VTRARAATALLVVAAVLLVAAPSAGPDLGFYVDWADATATADIFKLHGQVLSPSGVPLSQWSAGPGLLFALGERALGSLAPLRDAALSVGSVSALVFWWAFVTLLVRAGGGRPLLSLFGAGAAFVGTHAGFYSQSHGSESLAYGAGGLMLVLLTSPRWRPVDGAQVGVAAALLVLVRPQLALYALPALVLAAGRSWRARSEGARGAAVWTVTLAAIPLALTVLVTGVVNRWMTGSALQSPYAFSGAGFSSLDWRRPEFAAVLWHPFHGLLAYHPLYALGAAALVVCILRARDSAERALWLGGLFAVLANLYLQASWYVWWMGTLSFGMRGLALAALVLIPALVRALASAAGGLERWFWCLATVVCCSWSVLLLLQRHGPITSWRALLSAQARELGMLGQPEVGGALLAGLLLAALVVGTLLLDAAQADRTLAACSILLLGASLGYLLVRAVGRFIRRGALEELRVVMLVLLLVAVVLVPVALVARWRHVRLREAAAEGLGWSATLVLVAASVTFVPLARETERRIAAGIRPSRPMKHTGSVELDQAREAYYEYLELAGFDEKKAALLAFLEANGVEP
jgi:hypothetical protein